MGKRAFGAARMLLLCAFLGPAGCGGGDAGTAGDLADPGRVDPGGLDTWIAGPDDGTDEGGRDPGGDEVVADVPDLFPGVGLPCGGPQDCESGLCLDTAAGAVCTVQCAERCPEDWTCLGTPISGQDLVFVCVPLYVAVCRACLDDADCRTAGAACVDQGEDGRRCMVACGPGGDCPGDFACAAGPAGQGQELCFPPSGSCSCTVREAGQTRVCRRENEAGTCLGRQACGGADGWGPCDAREPAVETCNGLDDDCNDAVDDRLGSTTCGLGACLHEQPSCVDGKPVDCDPMLGQGPETCDGRDENCDGQVDEGFPDTDVDDLKDCVDLDDDDDGVPDVLDRCPRVADPLQGNLDGDDRGDACDDDDDGDGVDDDLDVCPRAADPGQEDLDLDGAGDACDPDDDNDTVADEADNCPVLANADQGDRDGDGLGDACDADDDDDGVPDGTDNCPWDANPAQADIDGDQAGDACDPDDDGDGVPDGTDNCPRDANAAQADADGDGRGDACDLDDDDDGVPDAADNCPVDANADQADCDGDGAGDACDPDDDNDGALDGVDCGLCDASRQPGAPEACNGLDDNCDGGVDEGGAGLCLPYACAGDQGCRDRCGEGSPCAPGWFCDARDSDGDGRTDECLPELPGGSPCGASFECADGWCGNGYCCGASGEDCCATDDDCAGLATAAVCDAPGACQGHRMVGFCTPGHACKAVQVGDPAGCTGQLCAPGRYCSGSQVRQDRFCAADGSCAADGNVVQECQGANSCCNYGCSNGTCTSGFRTDDLGCVYACYLQPVLCFCW